MAKPAAKVKDTAPQSVTVAVLQNLWHTAFKAIGVTGAGGLPPDAANTDAFLWELVCAQQLVRHAKAREDEARDTCITAGIMFNHKTEPRPAGISEQIAAGKYCSLTVTTKQPAESFDKKRFLVRLGLMFPDKKKEIDALVADCTGTNAVPHTFTSQLIVKDAP